MSFKIGYYLDEDNKWALSIPELKRSLDEGRKRSNPRVLCVINPGNPTGQYSFLPGYFTMKEALKFE